LETSEPKYDAYLTAQGRMALLFPPGRHNDQSVQWQLNHGQEELCLVQGRNMSMLLQGITDLRWMYGVTVNQIRVELALIVNLNTAVYLLDMILEPQGILFRKTDVAEIEELLNNPELTERIRNIVAGICCPDRADLAGAIEVSQGKPNILRLLAQCQATRKVPGSWRHALTGLTTKFTFFGLAATIIAGLVKGALGLIIVGAMLLIFLCYVGFFKP